MDFAIVLYMNDEQTAMVNGMIRELVPECGSDFCLGIVPHMAVAMKMDKEGLYKGFKKLSEIFNPFTARIDKMALIKWEEDDPYQELAVYELH